MDLLLYFFVLTTAILSMALIHIYYKLTDNSYVLDFFTFRVVSFLYSLLFIMTMIPSFEAMKITLTKLSIYSDIIGGIIFMFFLYESILSKEFSSRYKYFFAFLAIIAILIALDFTAFTFDITTLKGAKNLISTSVNFEIIILIIVYIGKISSHLRTQIIKFIILFIVSVIISTIVSSLFPIHELLSAMMVSNIFFFIYFLIKTLSHIKHLREKTKQIEKREINVLKDKILEFGITKREEEIILLVLKGQSNQEIADELFINVSTVKRHIYNIYQKMGIKKRSDLFDLL